MSPRRYTKADEAALRAEFEAPRLNLDPRWEWIEVRALGDAGPRYIRGPCKHLEPVPVDSIVTGETIATLCGTCLKQIATADAP